MNAPPEPLVVDARGRACPTPVIELAKAVRDLPDGALVALLSDDSASKVDVPVWCRMQRHTLVDQQPDGDGWRFVVRKGG